MKLLSILLFALVSSTVVSARPCLNNGFFRPNSKYDTNRHLLLSSLASNVSALNGFYSLSIGQGPDRVYGVGMCIPGAEAEVCSDCIEDASESLIQSCPNQTEAFTWSGGGETLCMVRYSNRSFTGSVNMDPPSSGYNVRDIKSNLTEFDQIWKELSLRMIVAASMGKSSSLSDNNKYFAAEIAALETSQNIYALMQCTPDISPENCKTCLRQSVDDYQNCCHGKRGGYVYRPNCIFRWDLYPFNRAFEQITSTGPQHPSSLKPSVSNGTSTAEEDSKTISVGIVVAIVVAVVIIVLALLALVFAVSRMKKSHFDRQSAGIDTTSTESLQFDYKTIEAATNKFSDSNKIGRGGFGEVFKGVLLDGTEVAVKRMSKASGQGAQEFKNEAVLVAKLQHRNLARLLGFVLKGEEKILVYEFVPNKSLDYVLFDPLKKGQLGWEARYNIIGGIARGVLYLHQDSRLIIIHRDLKASNILLDADMNPKISDFGVARIFGMDQTRAETRRIVGTYGYMSPEYAMQGQFSMKSDVYSFGVLVLEIITGKKTSSLDETDGSISNLVTHAWRLWREGSPLELVDVAIGGNYPINEVTRCIHVALLCVQEDPADRPTMPSVILMLTSNTIALPLPRQPGFFFQSRVDIESRQSTGRSVHCSLNDASISDLEPR